MSRTSPTPECLICLICLLCEEKNGSLPLAMCLSALPYIFKSHILHPKIPKDTQKYAVVCVQSGKFYTCQNIFYGHCPWCP